MRILYINPVGENPKLQEEFVEYLNAHKGPDTEITVESLGQAPHSLESYYYLSLIAPDLLRRIKQAENEGYDAVVTGCFCDPAMDACKEICEHMVVVGVMESAVHIAAQLAPRFSILSASLKSVQDFRDNLGKYGLSGRLASFRTLDIPVVDLMSDPSITARRMGQEVSLAISQDKAEAVILGCTLQLGHYKELQREHGVPVIDAALAGLYAAEHLVSVRDRSGWYTSKISSYAPTPKGELASMGLDKYYNIEGLF